MKEFWEQICDGRINRENLQTFLETPDRILYERARLLLSSVCCFDSFDTSVLPYCFSVDLNQLKMRKLEVVSFHEPLSVELIISKMERERDLVPANFEQFIGFVAQKPNDFFCTAVVCLGIYPEEYDSKTACIAIMQNGKLKLQIEPYNQVWGKNYSFLGRKMTLREMS